MGRFSKLETGGRGGEPAPDRDAVSPEFPFTPAAGKDEREDLDQAACLRLGDEALFRNDRRAALRWYSRAMDRDSRAVEAWVAMLRVLLFKGDLGEAQSWVNRGLTLIPGSPHLLALRAVLYARRGMMRQAINNSDAVLETAGTVPLAHMARGEVLLLADNKNAQYCFDQCLGLTPPDDWRTPLMIGLIHEDRRLWARAIHYYGIAAQRTEREPALWYHVGLCRAELGHAAQARKAFEQAGQICQPGDPLLLKLSHASTGSLWLRLRNLFRSA
ncbi:MAG: tetratricopeptide repeat protein [bacterium]|nr:tetratricopeptide repeat protein [bacterium]